MFSNDRSAKGLVPGLHKRKTKYTTTIQPRSFIPGHLSQRNEDVHKQNLCPKVFSSFIHHSHELQATQMSSNKQAVKQAGAHALELPSGLRRKEPGHTRQPGGTSRGFWRMQTAKPSRLWTLWCHLPDKIRNILRVEEGMRLRVWVMTSGRGYRRAAGGSLWWWPRLSGQCPAALATEFRVHRAPLCWFSNDVWIYVLSK